MPLGRPQADPIDFLPQHQHPDGDQHLSPVSTSSSSAEYHQRRQRQVVPNTRARRSSLALFFTNPSALFSSPAGSHQTTTPNPSRPTAAPRASSDYTQNQSMSTFRKKLAHTGKIDIGPKQLRPLGDIISSEKTFITDFQKATLDLRKTNDSLSTWGASEGDDLKDILEKGSGLLNRLADAFSDFSSHLTEVRSTFKSVRTAEEELADLKKRKDNLGSRITATDRKLQKMGPENKSRESTVEDLRNMEREFEGMEIALGSDEVRLGDDKRKAAARVLGIKMAALCQLAEKMTIVGELGKMLVELVPLETTEPGADRLQYNKFQRTSEIYAEADTCLEKVAFSLAGLPIPSNHAPGSTSAPTKTAAPTGFTPSGTLSSNDFAARPTNRRHSSGPYPTHAPGGGTPTQGSGGLPVGPQPYSPISGPGAGPPQLPPPQLNVGPPRNAMGGAKNVRESADLFAVPYDRTSAGPSPSRSQYRASMGPGVTLGGAGNGLGYGSFPPAAAGLGYPSGTHGHGNGDAGPGEFGSRLNPTREEDEGQNRSSTYRGMYNAPPDAPSIRTAAATEGGPGGSTPTPTSSRPAPPTIETAFPPEKAGAHNGPTNSLGSGLVIANPDPAPAAPTPPPPAAQHHELPHPVRSETANSLIDALGYDPSTAGAGIGRGTTPAPPLASISRAHSPAPPLPGSFSPAPPSPAPGPAAATSTRPTPTRGESALGSKYGFDLAPTNDFYSTAPNTPAPAGTPGPLAPSTIQAPETPNANGPPAGYSYSFVGGGNNLDGDAASGHTAPPGSAGRKVTAAAFRKASAGPGPTLGGFGSAQAPPSPSIGRGDRGASEPPSSPASQIRDSWRARQDGEGQEGQADEYGFPATAGTSPLQVRKKNNASSGSEPLPGYGTATRGRGHLGYGDNDGPAAEEGGDFGRKWG